VRRAGGGRSTAVPRQRGRGESRRQRAEGRRQKAEGRRAEGRKGAVPSLAKALLSKLGKNGFVTIVFLGYFRDL